MKKFLMLITFLLGFTPYVIAQDTTLNVFDLSSTKHTTVAEGQGYFPVLNLVEDRMFAVFRDGAGHLGLGGHLVYSYSIGEGIEWETPKLIVNSNKDDRNPAVGITKTGRIVVAYHEQGSYTAEGKYDPSLQKARAMLTWSDNEGKTWTDPRPVGVPGMESCSPYGRIVSASDDALLMNLYGRYTDQFEAMENIRSNQHHYAYVVRSYDNGETWGSPALIAPGHNETALLRINDNNFVAAARTIGMQRLDFCRSEDDGKTWSDPLRLTGPNQHPADLIQLTNGWILMLYGDRSVPDKVIRGMISRDHGRTWDINNEIIFSRPVRGDFGYPSAVITPNGQIAVMYYWGGTKSDGSTARAYLNLVDEAEFLNAYTETFNIPFSR